METPNPRLFNSRTVVIATSGSLITVLSVTSRQMVSGSTPVLDTISLNSSASPDSNCRPETLTDTASPVPSREISAHLTAFTQACSNTQAPIGTISPVDSANGMNCNGGTVPFSGCCHRSNASTPTRRSIASDTFG